jgi:hypothetical protein
VTCITSKYVPTSICSAYPRKMPVTTGGALSAQHLG